MLAPSIVASAELASTARRAVVVVAPPAALARWTRGAVVLRSDAQATTQSCFPATLEPMLVVRRRGDCIDEGGCAVPPHAVFGPRAHPLRLHERGPLDACGLMLRPAAMALFTDTAPAPTLDLDAAACSGALRGALREVHAAGDAAAIAAALFALLDGAVARAPAPSRRRAAAIETMLELLADAPRLSGAAAARGVGVRQLQRRVHDLFGMTPRRARTVLRTTQALHEALRTPPAALDVAQLALAHGCFDQSHLGRDVRRLAGASLAGLVRAAAVGDGAPPAAGSGVAPDPSDSAWAFRAGRAGLAG